MWSEGSGVTPGAFRVSASVAAAARERSGRRLFARQHELGDLVTGRKPDLVLELPAILYDPLEHVCDVGSPAKLGVHQRIDAARTPTLGLLVDVVEAGLERLEPFRTGQPAAVPRA